MKIHSKMSSVNENYSIKLKNHASNLSISFSEMLQRNDLIDVTLVADGYLFGVHRLILSAFSPYFRQMFTQIPISQQAFVFMKDVSKQTLQELITFIYCGEVNVGQENVTDFVHICKELKINGLADANYEHSNGDFDPDSTVVNHNGSQYQFPKPQKIDVTYSTTAFNGQQFQSTKTNRVHQQTNAAITSASSECKNVVYDHVTPNEVEPEYNEDSQNNYEVNFENLIEEKVGDNDGIHRNGYGINSQGLVLGQQNISQGDFILNAARHIELHGAGQVRCEPAPLKTKRSKTKAFNLGYNVIADIRKNLSGRDNLYHNSYKFYKNKTGMKKAIWCCTKNQSAKCKSTVSTMEIDGTIMMKILVGEHTHWP